MEHEHHNTEQEIKQSNNNALVIGFSTILSGMVILGALAYVRYPQVFGQAGDRQVNANHADTKVGDLEAAVIPVEGYTLPIVWGDLGKRMIAAGVIDEVKFKQVYATRGGLNATEQSMLFGNSTEPIRITRENANFLLNMLWAYGLAQKNPILEQGEMTDARYGGAENFASTGGWTLARGDAMQHYSKHMFVSLTNEQHAIVERVSRGIYRPCCGNSTHFPDCNHGMAMLGLLELMAANGVSESDMYKAALQVNAYWFPDTYLTLANYFKAQGVDWSNVEPKVVLGEAYSSAAGYRRVLSIVEPVTRSSSGGCGV